MGTYDAKALLGRLCSEPGENEWLEFKLNNADPEMIGRWISACANAAILAGRDKAFLVFGVENGTRRRVGTTVRLADLRKGGENFSNWLHRMVEPKMLIEMHDIEENGLHYSIITIEPSYDRPVKFEGAEFIRIGENVKKLAEFPEHERALWYATNRRKFESAVAIAHRSEEQVLGLLDVECYFSLSDKPNPRNIIEITRALCAANFIVDDMEGGYDITNLGAILFAKSLKRFPSIGHKAIRVIKYSGNNKIESDDEVEGDKGYAVGFSGLIKYVMRLLPREEKYIDGVRRVISAYPEIAVREVIANSLIHQDFTVSGSAPIIEVYSDRLEVSNPGNSLIEVDRIIDERRSRNEKLAYAMRSLGVCEERGGGIDKALFEIERMALPPPLFQSSQNSMKVVLFSRREFSKLTKAEKLRACFQHCVLKYVTHDYMSNTTLRARFSLPDDEYQAASTIISQAVRSRRIKPADPNQGNRNARYIPFWVG